MAKRLLNIADYTFNKTAKTVTFSAAYTGLQLAHVELITNVTDNIVIYQFNKIGYGGSLTGLVLTLDYDTSGMDNTDELQIFVESELLTSNVGISGSLGISNFPTGFNVAITSSIELEVKNDTGNPLNITGSITANTGLLQPLTDTQLRATAIPVSGSVSVTGSVNVLGIVNVTGSVIANTGLSQPLTDAQLRATAVVITGSVSGHGAFVVSDGGSSISIDDNNGSITVDGIVSSSQAGIWNVGQSGSWVIGQSGSWNVGLNAGTNNIGDVDVLTVPAPLSTTGGGSEATALRVTIANDSTGVVSIDDNGSSITIDGTVSISGTPTVILDSTSLSALESITVQNAAGASAVNIQDGGNSITVDGAIGQSGSWTIGQSGSWNVGLNAGVNNIGDVDVLTLPSIPAGSNNIGDVDVLTLPPIPAGTNNIGDVDVLTLPSIPAGTNNIGDVDVLTLPSTPTGDNTIGRVKLTDGTDVADVLDLTNSNPLTVAIVDGAGTQITSFGGGTQYTEGDTDASITGTVMMMEVAADTLQPVQGTVADGLLVNLGANNDVTVTGTVTATATDLDIRNLVFATDKVDASGTTLGSNSGVDIGDVTINNAAGASAVNIQDGGNTITVDGTVAVSNATFPVTDNGGSLTVDAPVATPVFVRLSDGAAAITTLAVDTELPTAAALADNTANPTVPAIGTFMHGWDATTWDRIRTIDGFVTESASPQVGMLAAISPDRRFAAVTLGTVVNNSQSFDVNGADSAVVHCGTSTTGTFTFEVTADGVNWQNAEVRLTGNDSWQGGIAQTPTANNVYRIFTVGYRNVRVRTVTTLGATVAITTTLAAHSPALLAIKTGPAPHNFGYTQVHKNVDYTTAQTGAALWTPATGRKIAVTNLNIATGGTTAAVVTVWFGATADTTFSTGTDQVVWRGEFAPSTTSRPFANIVFPIGAAPVANTIDYVLRVTTSANITIYFSCHGYEF